ncbi:MAG: O-methyltransferase [Gemmatimonadota bacterium]|nr:O-methyltransferase [Gemmatimonadota bacterium]MDE2985341.1 O-methyltransferase [Gemmatimonadota bacterium]
MGEGRGGEGDPGAAEIIVSGAPAPSELPHDRLDEYVRRLFAPEDDCLRAIRARAADASLPAIQLPPATARAVQILLRATGARRVLEIGTLAGYSAVWLARALPPDGELITLEIDPDRAAVARESVEDAGLAAQVEVRVGDALDLMVAMDPDPPFDAVFLDADKERYCDYLEQAARLVRHKGLLVADNALWRGEVLDPEGFGGLAVDIHRFNERVAADERFEATILPVGDGLMVGVRG